MGLFKRRTGGKPYDLGVLPLAARFDFKDDCKYVLVSEHQVTGYQLEGWKPVAKQATRIDGTMILMEQAT